MKVIDKKSPLMPAFRERLKGLVGAINKVGKGEYVFVSETPKIFGEFCYCARRKEGGRPAFVISGFHNLQTGEVTMRQNSKRKYRDLVRQYLSNFLE